MRRSTAAAALINHPFFRGASWLVVAVFAAAGSYELGAGAVIQGAVLLGLAVVGGSVLRFQRSLPSSIIFLLYLVVAVNVAGYVQNLWRERTMFDELVHASTSFAGMAALMWVTARRTRLLHGRRGITVVVSALVAGLLLGLAWEGFEWLIGIIGNRRDTLIDLAMDCLGAVAAGLLFSSPRARDAPTTA